MDISLFDYYLPKELIAQKPIEPRDHSRLLILDRKTQEIQHHYFYQILDYLTPQDVLVFNNTKVVPARLFGKKTKTGGKAEIVLIKPKGLNFFDFIHWPKEWMIIGQPELKLNQEIIFSDKLKGEIIEKNGYERTILFNLEGNDLKEEIIKLGQMPLPPYVNQPSPESFEKYQTVYASKEGAVAAPTAGFHFTESLLEQIKNKGIEIEFITLHVGLGTFLPVKEQEIEKHQMHSEYFILPQDITQKLNQDKAEGKRIISVGTTVARVLESCSQENHQLKAKEGWTNLYIYPGFQFRFTDALITNFHLPKSTLLMLVSAFAGRDLILKAYSEAIDKKYRFFSFGDAMFIT
ncbi:MAG: tRNA preQ1(34) S-adenosylmethionine ribosyltransferase-isomerase QueA [Minisyncoccia bacterium]